MAHRILTLPDWQLLEALFWKIDAPELEQFYTRMVIPPRTRQAQPQNFPCRKIYVFCMKT
jgi:hypothetical protein